MNAPVALAEATFRYRAAQPDGAVQTGTIVADGPGAAAEQLLARGLFAVEVVPLGAVSFSPRASRGLSANDLAVGLHSLATLLEAGLPVGRALGVFATLAPAGWRPLMPEIVNAVREGRGLADALAQGAHGLPPLVLGILRAGEAGSGIAVAVRRAADQVEQQAAMQAALRGALTYPAIVALTGVAAVALMVGVILPRFAALLGDLGQTLPPTTRAVLAIAAWARILALPVAATAVVGWVTWRQWVSNHVGRSQWEALLLATPVVGHIRLAAATSRVCNAMAALLDAGVPIAAALRHAEPAAANAAIGDRLVSARDAVLRGSRIADALNAHGALTPTAIRLVQTGEETGRLAAMLVHAARLEADMVARRVQGAVRLVEPALVLTLGGMIAFVAAALLQAVYSVRPGA